jgi:hypothetical protein
MRRRSGLARSALVTGSVRFCFYAGGARSTKEELVASISGHVPFGHSVSAACAVRAMTARVQQLRCLNHPIRSSLPTGLRLPVANSPRGSLTVFER